MSCPTHFSPFKNRINKLALSWVFSRLPLLQNVFDHGIFCFYFISLLIALTFLNCVVYWRILWNRTFITSFSPCNLDELLPTSPTRFDFVQLSASDPLSPLCLDIMIKCCVFLTTSLLSRYVRLFRLKDK